MRIAQRGPADSHHHRRVAVDQDCKRCFGRSGVASQESSQQFAIGRAAQHSMVKERFELGVDVGEHIGRHRGVSRGRGTSACSFRSKDRLLQLSWLKPCKPESSHCHANSLHFASTCV